MSVLTSASKNSISRGYFYYCEGNVLSCEQIDSNKYEGTVKGNGKEPYHVVLDINHPKKSSCTCPHANGYVTCKHMVALYFYIFPEEAEDYQDWMESSYLNSFDEDDDYYYDEDDKYEYYSYVNEEIPLCYDELLENFINCLSKEELKTFVRSTLNKNRYHTFHTYLKKEYQKYMENDKNHMDLIEQLRKRISSMVKRIDYDFYNSFQEILTTEEKEKIQIFYKSDSPFRIALDNILLIPELAVYSNYVWIIQFYKNKLTLSRKNKFLEKLNEFFKALKYYGIRNTLPKSNVLIMISLLKDPSIEDQVQSMIQNIKYWEYVVYVVEHTENKQALYNEFKKQMSKKRYKNKRGLSNLFLLFIEQLKDNSVESKLEYLYYDTILEKSRESFEELITYEKAQSYITKIKTETKDKELLEIVYATLNEVDDLYDLLVKQDKEYLIIRNIDVLKDKYSPQLFEYFYHQMNLTLDKGIGREVYYSAARYLKYISKLVQGKEYCQSVIKELRNSKHAKKRALFEEIQKVMDLI